MASPKVPRGAATADVYARAIVAASAVCGDDPIAACSGAPKLGRSLTAAASAISKVLNLPIEVVVRPLPVTRQGVFNARWRRCGAFDAAEAAAEKAVAYACWRPEARESVVAAVEPQLVAPEPSAPAPEPEPVVDPAPRPNARETMLRAAVRSRAVVAPSRPTAPDRKPATPPRTVPPVPPAPRPLRASLPADAAPARDLVLDRLRAGPLDSMNLASAIDRKELAVVTALSALKSEGLVADERVSSGPRGYRWKLTAKGAARG